MPLNIVAIFCAAALLLGLGGGYKLRDLMADAAHAKQLEQAQEQLELAEARMAVKADEYEAFRAQALARRDKATNTIREIYRDVEVSNDCAPVPDAVRVLDDALLHAGLVFHRQAQVFISQVASDDFVGFGIGVGNPAGNLFHVERIVAPWIEGKDVVFASLYSICYVAEFWNGGVPFLLFAFGEIE